MFPQPARVVIFTCSVLLAGLTGMAHAGPPACDALSGARKARADELLSRLYAYDCCDATLRECLAEKPVCSLVWRLADNVCRRVAAGQESAAISRALTKRARSMMPGGKPATIDLYGVPLAGDEKAPVILVEYACGTCPYCAKITPKIHHAVVAGPLRGKAKLYFKVFPLRSHPFSKEVGLGFMAAAELGRFWEFVLHAYPRYRSYSADKMLEWAHAAGLEKGAFAALIADPKTRKRLVDSKKEGIVNKVTSTPTFFINGRMYVGDLTVEEIIDVVAEEYDRMKKIKYRKGD